MKCIECNGYEFDEDDRLGETICVQCGYVQVTNIFEDKLSIKDTMPAFNTDSGRHHYFKEADTSQTLGSFVGNMSGDMRSIPSRNRKLIFSLKRSQQRFRDSKNVSINKGLLECNMVLSPFLPNNSLKNRVHTYYKKLFFSHKFGGTSLPIRACALVVICLRENSIPISIAEIAETNTEDPHKISKAARYFSRHLGKSHILHNMPVDSWTERVCSDLKASKDFTRDARQVVHYVNAVLTGYDIRFSKSYMAASIWITSLLRKRGKAEHTQQDICDICRCSSVGSRIMANRLFDMLNVNKKMLQVLNVDAFCAGVR